MTKRASFARNTRVQVITTRKRVYVLLFVASYFVCCGGVEMNPGPLEKDDYGTGDQPQASKTVSTELATARPSPDTCIAPDMASQMLDAIRQQNMQFQSLEVSMNQTRNDLSSIKTDMRLVAYMYTYLYMCVCDIRLHL